jgi:hypothetical protein
MPASHGPLMSGKLSGASQWRLLNDSAFPDDVEIYAPTSGTFSHIGHTHSVHEFSTATRLPDGTVLIAGGQVAGGNGSMAVELYTLATGTFAQIADLTVGRHAHTVHSASRWHCVDRRWLLGVAISDF